ncbi:hypothetical protein V6N11_075487 [Hibiscus sabdariffa]|uniref:Zinc knuckle CX2CX4HX4C domain-containing protein n=1 Tax=Hibiscus sabdariffa TaxID=183260 RepID=A0ABR2R6M4_9ROSI
MWDSKHYPHYNTNRYYCKALFRRIAQVIGHVIKVDYNTREGEQDKFAQLAIMVDLNKPLKLCTGINNFIKKLEYKGLQQRCFECGFYGHSKDICGLLKEKVGNAADPGPQLVATDIGESSLFGPWMDNGVVGLRFMALQDKMMDEELHDPTPEGIETERMVHMESNMEDHNEG